MSECNIAANPCNAFVTRPSEVAMSVESAKNARNASDIPSNRTSGRSVFVGSAKKLALQDLLGDVAHARARAHGRLLDHLEGLGLVESSLVHQQLLGTLDDLAGLNLVVGLVGLGGLHRLVRRGLQYRGQLRQDLAATKRLDE